MATPRRATTDDVAAVNQPLRVLYVAHSVSANGGGMERISHALVSANLEDVEFTVMASDGLDELPPDVDVIRLALPRRPAFLRIIWFYLRGSILVRRHRHEFDLVHTCGAVVAPHADLVSVHLCHAAVDSDAREELTGWRRINAAVARAAGMAIERSVYRNDRVGVLAAVSPAIEAELEIYYPEVARTVVANGVDVAHYICPPRSVTPTGGLRAVMVTGDFALKGVGLAIEALTKATTTSLRVVGRGPIAQYQQRAEQLDVADRVSFTGQVDDVRSYYEEADVVVCVSHYESFGLYLVEAALAGCAVVATEVGVASALVGNDDGGLLIERSSDALAEAFNFLAEDPLGVLARASTAQLRARNYSVTAMLTNYEAKYQALESGELPGTTQPVVLHVGLESARWRVGGLNRYLEQFVSARHEMGRDDLIAWIDSESVEEALVATVPPGQSWPRRMFSFARVIRTSAADVIDVHFAAHAYVALLSGALKGRPLVVHFQGPWSLESATMGDGRLAVALKLHVERFVLRRAETVVTLSNAFRSVVVQRYGVAPQRVEVIAPGVGVPRDLERVAVRQELAIDSAEKVWLAVRRLVPRMGLDVLVELFAEVRHSNERLVVVGEGPLQASLEQLASEHGVASVVTFLGRVDDETLSRWYLAADVSVVPSLAHEGFGLVVYESLAYGTPVIATDVGGLKDAARGCEAVVLAPLEPTAWRAAVNEVQSRGDLRHLATLFAHAHGWSEVAHRHDLIYRRAVAGVHSRGVVVLDHTARLSGGELAIARLLSGLDRDQWKAHVILAEPGPLEAELEHRGISYEVQPLATRTRDLSRDALSGAARMRAVVDTARYVSHLRRVLRRRQPDLVHTNSMKAHVYGVAACFGTKRPVVMHVRDQWAPPYLSLGLARALRLLARIGPDEVLANSRLTAESVGVRAAVLASPVEDQFFAVPPLSVGPLVRLAVVGRLAPWKGQDLAVRALSSVVKVSPVHLDLVGDAMFGEVEFVEELHQLVADLNLEEHVSFLGHVSDVATYLATVDITILTSRSPEPFGNVVVEAMAAGRAVVVPNQGGVTEFVTVKPGYGTGFFYEMGDATSLADVLGRVVADYSLRWTTGARARRAVEPFRVSVLAPSLTAFYDELV